MSAQTQSASFEACQRALAAHGVTDTDYLRRHWRRFVATKALLERSWRCPRGRVLDLGAHWLHQSLLFAQDGYRVTAADLPATLAMPSVVGLAREQGIALAPVADLAAPRALNALGDDAFDLVLVCEVIEHLAFNPVELWREIHRVLVAGGRIVVTTPNYYALTRRHLSRVRTLFGGGGGLGIDEILDTPTHGHHWKEYARRELVRYFARLSPDFAVRRARHVEDEPPPGGEPVLRGALRNLRRFLPPLRERLHVEIDLTQKSHGITLTPRWDAH